MGASEDDTERIIQLVVTLKGEGVHRNTDQQTAFSLLFQDGGASAAAWPTGNVSVQLGGGKSSTGLITEPGKVEVQHWCLFWT